MCNQPAGSDRLGNLLMCSDLTLGPFFKKMRIAKLKNAYNSLFLGPRIFEFWPQS